MSNNNKSGSGIALVIGALAGAAAGYWLNTTEGKLWRKRTSQQAKEFSNDLNHRSEELKQTAKQKAGKFSEDLKHASTDFQSKMKAEAEQMKKKSGELTKKGEHFVNDAKKGFKSDSEIAASKSTNAIKEGVEKAKERLDDLDAELDNSL